MSGIGKSKETESRGVFARGGGEEQKLTVNGHQGSCKDGKWILKLDW